jgi:hypothetical protein
MAREDDAPKQFCPECGFELEHIDTNTARTGHEGELERVHGELLIKRGIRAFPLLLIL